MYTEHIIQIRFVEPTDFLFLPLSYACSMNVLCTLGCQLQNVIVFEFQRIFSVADCSCRFRGKIGLFSFVKFRFFVLNLVFFGVSFGVCLLRAIHIHHHVECATICAICYSLFSREFACEQKRQQQQKSNHVCRCMNARCVNCECKICSRTTLSLLVLRRYAVMLLHAHSLIHSYTHFVSVNRILSMAYNFDMFFIYSFESRWYAYLSVDFFRIRIFFELKLQYSSNEICNVETS